MDVRIVVAVVLVLGFIGALAVGGITIASAAGHQPPDTLGTIAGTCVGALAMLLVNPLGRQQVHPVQAVVNTLQPPK